METALKKRRQKPHKKHAKLPPKISQERGQEDKKSMLPVMFGVAAVTLLLLFGIATYDSESDIHKHVARFLSKVTSRDQQTDYHLGENVYAIMMDAGSTGSRILVFTFSKSPTDGSLKLLDEFFKEVKPGISSYALEPHQAAESINGLFEDAKKLIPSKEWANTPASLKATAGLRMLPEDQQKSLLSSIETVFQNSGFLVKPNAVSIINGTAEGLYLWTTINFLLDKLQNNLNDTVAVIDMGGGSTQLALVPTDPATTQNAPKDDIQTLQLLGQPAKFYIHSYLGIGLMGLRIGFLRFTNASFDIREDNFFSSFLPEGFETYWEFSGRKYLLKGIALPDDAAKDFPNGLQNEESLRYAKCRRAILKMIKDRKVHQVKELKRRELYAVSYYFDRAVEANLIEESTGGSITAQDYCEPAKAACANPDLAQPYACIDLAYLCAILSEGLGLSNDHVINLKKKIDGHETSWALGAALFDLDGEAKKKTGL